MEYFAESGNNTNRIWHCPSIALAHTSRYLSLDRLFDSGECVQMQTTKQLRRHFSILNSSLVPTTSPDHFSSNAMLGACLPHYATPRSEGKVRLVSHRKRKVHAMQARGRARVRRQLVVRFDDRRHARASDLVLRSVLARWSRRETSARQPKATASAAVQAICVEREACEIETGGEAIRLPANHHPSRSSFRSVSVVSIFTF